MKQRVIVTVPVNVFDKAEIGRSVFDLLENTMQIVFEGEGIVVSTEDLEKVVRVRFLEGGTGRTQKRSGYCYSDPFGDLKVGDLVDVPTRYAVHNLAKVIGLGLDGFEPYGALRNVTSKYVVAKQ